MSRRERGGFCAISINQNGGGLLGHGAPQSGHCPRSSIVLPAPSSRLRLPETRAGRIEARANWGAQRRARTRRIAAALRSTTHRGFLANAEWNPFLMQEVRKSIVDIDHYLVPNRRMFDPHDLG